MFNKNKNLTEEKPNISSTTNARGISKQCSAKMQCCMYRYISKSWSAVLAHLWMTVTKSRTVAWISPHNLAAGMVSALCWETALPTLLLLSSPDCCSSLLSSDLNLNLPVAGTLSTKPEADSAKTPMSSDSWSNFDLLLKSVLAASAKETQISLTS